MKTPFSLLVAGSAGLAIALTGCGAALGTFDPDVPSLEKAIEDQAGVPVTVECPKDIPLQKGKITDCTVSDGIDRKILRITQDDAEGHYTWEITPQDAP